MRYTISEILTNTSGYIFYQNPEYDVQAQYNLCAVSVFLKPDEYQNTVFIPIKIYINNALTETFFTIEKYIKAGIRSFMFDQVRFEDKKYYHYLMSIIEQYRDSIDLIIMVPDTLGAIFDMANYTRCCKMSKSVKYLAVTGSIGKTSTTEMIYGILKRKFKIYRGEPCVNIKLRIAHKFLETDADIDYLLFECSGQTRGYLKYFSELIMPDAAIITKVSGENIGEYKTLANLAKEKSTLLCAMSGDSFAVLNGMDVLKNESKNYDCVKKYINEGDYELVKSDKSGSEFIYNNEKYYIPVVGLHQIDNAIRVIELSKYLGISNKDIYEGLKNYEAVGNRWVVDKFNGAAEFITDCPNNPSYDTVISNIDTFLNLYKDTKYKRIIITRIKSLGDFEEQTYLNLAEYISALAIQELVCVGSEIRIIRDYVKSHSDIKVVWFEKPVKIDENDELIKYLLSSLNFEQATLLKGQRKDGNIGYGTVKDVLRKILR